MWNILIKPETKTETTIELQVEELRWRKKMLTSN